MSGVTFIWALVVGACLTMALPHLLIGIKRRAAENLFFTLAALSVAAIACSELAIMHSRTTGQIGQAIQSAHVGVFLLLLGIVGFVHFYFHAGRHWLALSAAGVRLVSLIINLASSPNANYREITSLRHFNFLGEKVAMPEGVLSPWTHLSELSSILLLAYVVDASITLWRRGGSGNHRRAAVVGGSITLFIILAAGLSAIVHAVVGHLPYMVSLPFLGVVVAMGFELSYDILGAAQTARQLRLSGEALRESEVRMNLATNAASLGLWVWNIEKDSIWMTPEGRMLFGFAEDESVNLGRFLQAVYEEDRSSIERLIRASVEGGEYERDYRVVNSKGEPRWVAGYGRLEFDEQGKPALRGVIRDITKRKLTEEALRESEERFRIVANLAPVMIWMSGPNKEGIFFNKGWLDFTGRTANEELGEGWIEGVHAEDRAHCIEVCGQAFGQRVPFTVEYRLRRKDGEYRWLLDTGTPRFDTEGTFLGYIGSCIDIGERKQAEMDHQLQSMELARVGRLALMGEMAASLAHEINNPLGAMVANASAGQRMVAQGAMGTEELQELLGDIVADGHRAREVIQGIRNMTRRGEASHSLVAINEVIRDLLRIVRADALARMVSLFAEVDPHAGVVMADRVQLLQVMLNLTINAFEASSVVRADARRVTIRAERVENGTIRVSVRDSGPGFPEGIGERLFESFFSTKAEGTGMGLSIARSIIEAHGGTLSGENCAEGGARFTICLPEATKGISLVV